MAKHAQFWCVVFIVLGAASLCWCIYRDLHIEKQYPGDLRNRVVGARMQLDGLSPYFHHWKPAEGFRYYDWDNYSPTLKVSNATATPFFHQLLYPLANLSQRTISRIWMVLEYLVLATMTLLAWRMTKTRKQKYAAWFTGLFFLHTYAWLTNVEMGQLYIFIPFFALIFYNALIRKANLLNACIAGASAMALVLVRPNTMLLLLPFVLLVAKFSLRYKLVFGIAAFVCLAVAFGSRSSRFYWSDYLEAMKEQVKLHQELGPAVQQNLPVPLFENFEGWNRTRMEIANKFPFYKHSGEHGNMFVLLNSALHVKTPVWVLSALCASFIVLLCWLYFKKYKPVSFEPFSIALLGSCLYMTSDLFSPVHRFLYNGAFWIFPLLLVASCYSASVSKLSVAGIVAGMLLNSLPVGLFPMQHSLGEYVMFAAFLHILLFSKPDINPEKKQSSLRI
ncbi:MAG: DUF2029 domain-containing protein [Williamsia sp.]|nr:DUF2029 domain-containing protein [Williamsia sp.]